MVVVDDVMLFWLLCCVDVWNKRGVIVALLVGPLALVIVEVVWLVPIVRDSYYVGSLFMAGAVSLYSCGGVFDFVFNYCKGSCVLFNEDV